MKPSDVEQKIKAKVYPRLGVATAVVNRAGFTRADKARLVELANHVYTKPAEPVLNGGRIEPIVVLKSAHLDGTRLSVNPPTLDQLLDQKLLLIAFQLLGLCVEYKMSREDMYARLEARLKAGMG